MGLRQSLRVATGALLLACGLQFAHANSDPHTIVFGVAPGPYGDMVKQAIAPTLKEKGYKVDYEEIEKVISEFKKTTQKDKQYRIWKLSYGIVFMCLYIFFLFGINSVISICVKK